MLKHPDIEDLSTVQWDAIKNHVWNMEKAIAGNDWNDPVKGYRAYFDTVSVMNYIIAQELTRNIDGYRLSTSIYRDLTKTDQRFKLSIWDHNPSMGNGDYISAWSTEGWSFNNNQYTDGTNPQFFNRMLQDETFYTNVKELWTKYRTNRFTEERINTVIDSLVNLLRVPSVRNYATWGYPADPWPNYYYAYTWDQELTYLRNWIKDRVKWIDSQWSAEIVNKVANGTFDAAYARSPGLSNATLAEWRTEGDVGLTSTISNVYEGKFALSMYPNRKAWQTLTELTPGKYTFRCMVKTQGDPKACFEIKYHRKNNSVLSEPIRNNVTYYKIEIKDIEVDNHFAEILFATGNSTGDIRLWVDNVEFFKQPAVVGLDEIKTPQTAFNLKVNYIDCSLEIEFPDTVRNDIINIYDILGNTIYTGYAYAPVIRIEGLFVRNRMYIVRVGNTTKKALL